MESFVPILFVFFTLLLYISCTSEGDDFLAPMERIEQDALYSAIQGFVGKEWNGSDLYPDPCGWTPIEGVSCDFFNGFWRVTVLSIGQVYDNSLNCTAEAHFGHPLFELKYLRKLSFLNCFLSSHHKPVKLPKSGWDRLANSLEQVEFRSNPGLIGGIPSTFGCLTNLESLVLIENGLTGQIPSEIGNLVKLKRLVLAGNRLFGQIPASLGGLSNLLILDASRNSLSGALPSTLGGLNSLIKLDLSSNFLTGKLPREIGDLKSVTLLDLSYNNFSGGLTDSIQEMCFLQELLLSHNPNIGGDLMIIQWKSLQKLEVLDISSTGVTGNVPHSMTELKKLRFLGLNNNRLTGNIPEDFGSLPYISSLYLNGNNFTGELEFTDWFYEKMGSHFRASDNANLCLMSSRHVLVGVKPCQQ